MRKNKQLQLNDQWIKCIAVGGNFIATAVRATNLINHAREKHKVSGSETIALGEGLMSALLLASTCKKGERISLSVKGDKFLKQVIADANADGEVRGFLHSKEDYGDLDFERGPWQNGTLSVVRLKLHEKEPYVGTVPLVTGYLAKDLTFYLNQSEQIPSAVGLTVNKSKSGKVDSAGAFLIQVLPGATSEEIQMVEENLKNLESLSQAVATDSNPTLLLAKIFNNTTFTILEEKALSFSCNCSKERILRAFRLLGEQEISLMINEDHGAKVNCDFCNAEYVFSEDELKELL